MRVRIRFSFLHKPKEDAVAFGFSQVFTPVRQQTTINRCHFTIAECVFYLVANSARLRRLIIPSGLNPTDSTLLLQTAILSCLDSEKM